MARPKYRHGTVQLLLCDEERVFLLGLVKHAKPKDEIEERILKRIVRRTMGYSLGHGMQIHPPKECPICERIVAYKSFERHHFACKERKKTETKQPPIDPVVWEMMGGRNG